MSLLPVSPIAPLAVAGTALGSAGGAVVGTFGRMLRAALNPVGGTNPAAAMPPAGEVGSIDAAAAARQAAALRSEFAARFRALLAEHGIESGRAIELALDEFGELRVVGFHPQSAAIHHALAAAPELVDLFRELASAARQAPDVPRPHAVPRSQAPAWEGEAAEFPLPYASAARSRFVLAITPEAAEARFDV